MSSAGKLFFGTSILVAAIFTARYVHHNSPPPIPTIPKVQPPAAKLTWQVPATAAPAPGPIEIATAREASGEVQFARLTSAQEAVAPPEPIDRNASTGQSAASSNSSRPPVPFVVSPSARPESQLMAVDDEEADSPSAAGEVVHHTVQFGETLPQIAMQYTGRRENYMAIYQANLDVLTNPAEITPGIVLKIPVR